MPKFNRDITEEGYQMVGAGVTKYAYWNDDGIKRFAEMLDKEFGPAPASSTEGC